MTADPTALDDEALMRALQSGEDVALNRLMERWQVPLRRFLYRWTQREADAADLAQETFVRIYRHRARFRAGARFSTWMFQIAVNLARDWHRHRRRHPEEPLEALEEPDSGASPSVQVTGDERIAEIRRAIANLPDELREAVLLFEYEDRSHAEIAEMVGASPKAVETRLYRARARLRQALSRFLQDG